MVELFSFNWKINAVAVVANPVDREKLNAAVLSNGLERLFPVSPFPFVERFKERLQRLTFIRIKSPFLVAKAASTTGPFKKATLLSSPGSGQTLIPF